MIDQMLGRFKCTVDELKRFMRAENMISVKVMGVEIGTAMRRGDVSCDNTVYYGFVPKDGTGLPYMEDATIDFINGTIEHWRDNHTFVKIWKLLPIIRGM